MLGCQVLGYKRVCAPSTGGSSNLYVGDANDFDFTLGEQVVAGSPVGYSAIAYKTSGNGAAGTAVLSGATVGSAIISAGGTGYFNAPTVSFTGGGGTGAAATANVVNGVVTGITVTNAGTGYTSAPTIVFAAAGATAAGGAYLYEISSLEDSINVKQTQSYADGSTEWAQAIIVKAVQQSQSLTNFTSRMDAAAACCQLVFVEVKNDGKVFVYGERYVNGSPIAKWRIRQDGTEIDGGTGFKSFNGANISFKGTYSRAANEFIGGLNALAPFLN